MAHREDTYTTNSTYRTSDVFLAYTAIFLVVMAFITFVFLTAGKSFVWDDDGPQEAQHVLYAGKYWNDFFSSLAAGEFSFPTWDSNYGLGGGTTPL